MGWPWARLPSRFALVASVSGSATNCAYFNHLWQMIPDVIYTKDFLKLKVSDIRYRRFNLVELHYSTSRMTWAHFPRIYDAIPALSNLTLNLLKRRRKNILNLFSKSFNWIFSEKKIEPSMYVFEALPLQAKSTKTLVTHLTSAFMCFNLFSCSKCLTWKHR